MARAVVADVASHALRHSLPREARPERRVPAGVGVDDRHPPRQTGVGADLPGVAGRVHEFVAVVDAFPRHPGERDGGLAVVRRRGGQDAAHGDIAVRRVYMEPVAAPALPVSLRVPLGADVAGLRKLGHHLTRGHPALQPPPGRVGSLTTSSPFLGRPRLRLGRSFGAGFGAGLSRPTIAVESLDMWPTSVPSYAALTSAPCTRSGSRVSANHAKARENVDSLGTSDTRRPAAQAAERRIVPEPVDQGPRGREVPHRPGRVGPRQRVPVGGWAPDAAAVVMEMPLHGRQAGDRHEPAVRLPQRTDLPGEEGEKFPLEPVPGL